MDLIKEFEAQRLHGGKKSWYTGATFLPGDSFVLVDYCNSRCCLYDSACNFVSEISFSATPWDVCHIKGNIIAISFPHKNKIEFLAANNTFEFLLTANTKRACYGLSTLDEDHLVFSGYNNEEWRDCWGIIDKKGEEKFYHELQGDSSRDQSYVALNSTKTQVYVTWSNRRVLQCFGIEGDFKFSIELINKPLGVCVNIDDSIFVLGHSSNNIHHISPSGELLNEISKDIPQESCKICTSLNKTYILITNRHKETRDKCFIYYASDNGDSNSDVVVAVSVVSGLWYVILIIVFVVCAGTFSLCAFLICWCKERRDRKNGIFPRNTPAVPVPTPLWVQTIQSDRNMEVHGFSACSDGIIITGPTSVVRFRQGNQEADGARWSIGLEHGKHVFEVVWPDTSRGTYATIGVGSLHTPLHRKPKTSLIGMTESSLGLDIVRKRIIYNGEPKKTYPTIFHVPEKFLMYVDCDSGKLSFGTDECFWGIAFENIDRQMYPLHIMAGLTEPNANVQIFYKGSAVDSPYNMAGPSTICAPGDYSLPMEIPELPTYEQASATKENIQPLKVPASPPPPYNKMHETY